MEVPDPIKPFWSEFLVATRRPAGTALYDVFRFGDRESAAESLSKLVLTGTKRATSSLLREYEAEGRRVPQPGDLSVVTSWSGTPLCVIEATDVSIRAFDKVDGAFAADEGEGDRSLDHWRATHWAFFGRLCEELGVEPCTRMQIVCERFTVVFIPAPA